MLCLKGLFPLSSLLLLSSRLGLAGGLPSVFSLSRWLGLLLAPPLERNWVDVAMVVAPVPSTYYVSLRGMVFVFGRAPL